MHVKQDLGIQTLIDFQYTNVWEKLIDKTQQLITGPKQLAFFNTFFNQPKLDAQRFCGSEQSCIKLEKP